MSAKSKTWGPNTLNNPTDQDIEVIKSWQPMTNRMIVTLEKGESGTPHLQFTITFKEAMRMAALKKLHGRVHWEKSLTKECCFLYNLKDGSELILQSDTRAQGTRSDLKSAAEILRTSGMKRLREELPDIYIRYAPGLSRLSHANSMDDPYERDVRVIRVDPAVTTLEIINHANSIPFFTIPKLKWWDGYEGQDAIVINMAQQSKNPPWYLTDGRPLSLPIKNGFVTAHWTKVYIWTHDEESFDFDEVLESGALPPDPRPPAVDC